MRRELWVGGEGENGVGQILHFLMFFSSFPNGGPVLNSVVNLWGFCWGVWRLSGSLGVGSGSWKDLKEEGRDSNWLCAEGSVCWRGRCVGFAMAQHWGRPTLWGPEGILASAEDCHLEESLNCFLKKLVYLRREKNTRGKMVSLCRKSKKLVKIRILKSDYFIQKETEGIAILNSFQIWPLLSYVPFILHQQWPWIIATEIHAQNQIRYRNPCLLFTYMGITVRGRTAEVSPQNCMTWFPNCLLLL